MRVCVALLTAVDASVYSRKSGVVKPRAMSVLKLNGIPTSRGSKPGVDHAMSGPELSEWRNRGEQHAEWSSVTKVSPVISNGNAIYRGGNRTQGG